MGESPIGESGIAAQAPARPAPEGAGAGRKVLHIIGYSHVDAAWLWPWRDSSNLALTTFHSALDRMNEFPEFCFSASSSMHYRWVQRADPRMFGEIRERIRQGRWEVVGAWPVEPDCNLPAAESFARHCLYGKEYCRGELGADVRIGLNPDSFGHAAGLPEILRHANYGYYVFMRPQPQEQALPLPLVFWWEAPDGSRVLTLRICRTYDGSAADVRRVLPEIFMPGLDHAAFFLGVGDHGGAVTKRQIEEILAMRQDASLPELRFSTLKSFFAAVESSPGFAALPVIQSELQHHSRGCYSANGEVKFVNRRAERGLSQAETIALAASLSAGHPYPGEEFAASWWKLCFNQFHDLMAGTALYSDYRDLRDGVGYATETATTSKVEALETMSRRTDLRSVRESALFLFNPLPWRRRVLVDCIRQKKSESGEPLTQLIAAGGEATPVQWRPSPSMTPFYPRLAAWVELPACGYKVFELAPGDAPAPGRFLDFFTVSESGLGLSSLRAADGVEMLARPIGMVAIRDTSDTWAHDVARFRDVIGRPELVSSRLVEDGPVLRVTRQFARWRNSEIYLDIMQFADSDTLRLKLVVNWREQEQMLKLEIPTAFAGPRIFAKVPGAAIERKVNGDEEPCQDWAAVQGRIGNAEYSVAILNRETYSYDCLDGLFRTVVIRSAPFARHNPAQVPAQDASYYAWQDQGRQERTFWIACAQGPQAKMNLDRKAEELQTPAEYVFDSAHSGPAPRENSFLEVTPANVWVLAVKRAESGGGVIVRVQERSGEATRVRLKSALLGLDDSAELAPWALKTFLIEAREGTRARLREVSLLEA